MEEEGAHAFKGIPYAAPPVGELRWQEPQAVAAWDEVLDASNFGARCPAAEEEPSLEEGNGDLTPIGEEDCLFLNVWTPADRGTSAALPVMFFIHGGANLFGSADMSVDFLLNTEGGPVWYDGARIASRGDVVVVTVNYRLGALGFLAHPDLLASSLHGAVGNYGILDQIAALEWVQQNIAAFGGDPDRVMIFGQSAGAYNVCTLLASPLAAGLFSRAAMHSGSCALHSPERAETNSIAIAEELGCEDAADTAACLRSLPADAFSQADATRPSGLGQFNIFSSVDGYVVNEQPINTIVNGGQNRVPFLVGSNSDEYAHRFEDLDLGVIDTAAYELFIASYFQLPLPTARRAAELYPLSDYPSAARGIGAIVEDRNINCPARLYANTMAVTQSEPVYRYHFSRVLSDEVNREANGAYHSTELLYLFQHMNGDAFSAVDDDRVVEAQMLRYWTRFAANANPNGGTDAEWPQYEEFVDPYLQIDVESTAKSLLKKEQCDFWLSLSVAG